MFSYCVLWGGVEGLRLGCRVEGKLSMGISRCVLSAAPRLALDVERATLKPNGLKGGCVIVAQTVFYFCCYVLAGRLAGLARLLRALHEHQIAPPLGSARLFPRVREGACPECGTVPWC